MSATKTDGLLQVKDKTNDGSHSAVSETGSTRHRRGRGKQSTAKKEEPKIKEPPPQASREYSKDMVNFSIMKKYDPKLTADQQMGAQNGGESHLTRATLNLIIRESLPSSVRAQKDTIELICYLANAFVDLLSDISNNVCYDQKKKVIIPEHTLRALQELHLDEYLPFILLDNQSTDSPDPEIPCLNTAGATQDQREEVIQ